MKMFKLLLLSYIGFTSYVLHAVSDRPVVVVGEKPVKPPKILKGRKRIAKGVSNTNIISRGASYLFGLIQRPRITMKMVFEGWTPVKGQYPEPLLMLETRETTINKKKPPMGNRTTAALSFGSGIAVMWAIHMIMGWFAARKQRRNQAPPDTQYFVPQLQAWPAPLLRTMKPATLRALLDDQYATAINLETLMEALNLSPLVSSFRNYKLSTLLTQREEDVRASTGISQDQCENIFNGARYLQALSTQQFMIN